MFPNNINAPIRYSGGSLVDVIDSLGPPKRCYDRPFRLVVTDVFKHPQMGLSVAGKVSSLTLTFEYK